MTILEYSKYIYLCKIKDERVCRSLIYIHKSKTCFGDFTIDGHRELYMVKVAEPWHVQGLHS